MTVEEVIGSVDAIIGGGEVNGSGGVSSEVRVILGHEERMRLTAILRGCRQERLMVLGKELRPSPLHHTLLGLTNCFFSFIIFVTTGCW